MVIPSGNKGVAWRKRNNARCPQAMKTMHGLDQDVDRTPHGRVNQNDRGQR